MSERKPRSTLLDTLRALINEARIALETPNSCPAIKHKMLSAPFQRKLAKKRGLRLHLLAKGLEAEIRTFLKHDDDEEEEEETNPRQLEMWKEQYRTIIKDIGRARVFVPSRGEFVDLVPKAISPAEADEAGDYLVNKGQDCIRIGKQLKRLAAMGWRS
jgi:hypothetical protein